MASVYQLLANELATEINFMLRENAGVNWLAIDEYLCGRRPFDEAATRGVALKVQEAVVSDVLPLGGDLIVSDRLRTALCEVADSDVKFLPLKINARPYAILLVDRVVDCLDRERSVTRNVPGSPGRIMRIDKYVFDPGRIPAGGMFRIPEKRAAVFATDPARQHLVAGGFSGLDCIDIGNPPPGFSVY